MLYSVAFSILSVSLCLPIRLVHDGDGRPHIASVRGACGVASSPSQAILPGSRGGGSGGRGSAQTGGTPTGIPGSGGAGSSGPGSTEPPVGTVTPAGSCTPSRPCLVQVYLGDILLDEADFDIITTWDLGGVEYCTGSNMPVRYRVSGSACGVMLLWSK